MFFEILTELFRKDLLNPKARRTIANQEVLALIAPLGKLTVTHQFEKKSVAAWKRPILASGAKRANTSCTAADLLAQSI